MDDQRPTCHGGVPADFILDEYPTAPQARVALPAYGQSCGVEHRELVADLRRTLGAAE
ncbi:hypothetical protein ABFW14_19565 [Mycolicibacterium fortuitum]|uniref:hypothetical protein n=1 Tax=Mycolicibacterium fortuitum TaxID=1766 RepID=UPI0034CE5525